MKKQILSLFLSVFLLAGCLFSPQMTLSVSANEGFPIQSLSVNGISIEEFQIVHLNTAAETELRPTVRNLDLYSLGATAAKELQLLLKEATGKELVIQAVDDLSEVSSKAIVLGFDAAMGGDEFSVAISDDKVTIIGGLDKGLWYGVYEFLEEGAGYRFLTQNFYPVNLSYIDSEYATVDLNEKTVDLKNRSWSEKPVFAYRSIAGVSYGSTADADWATGWSDEIDGYYPYFNIPSVRANLASKQNGIDDDKWGVSYPCYGGGEGTVMSHAHAFQNLLPAGMQGSTAGDQPCLTDQATYDALLEAVLDLIDMEINQGFALNHTVGIDMGLISLGWNDNTNYCTCGNCTAKIAELGNLTDLYIDYVNKIAAVVAEQYPGVYLMALPYNVTTEPPVNVVPADNVAVLYCMYGCNKHSLSEVVDGACADCAGTDLHGDSDVATSYANIKRWTEICSRVYVWEYMDNFGSYIAQSPSYNVKP